MVHNINSSLRKVVLSGSKWSTLSVSLQAFFQVLAVIILARLLSPAEFGIVALTSVFINFASLIPQMGFGPALIQRVTITHLHIRTAFTCTLIFSLVSLILVHILAPHLAQWFGNQ